MLAHTHIALGIATGLAIVHFTDTAAPSSVELVALILGSLAPDIDSSNSLIGKPGQMLERFLPKGPRKILDFCGGTITKSVNRIFGHRGFFHWSVLALGFIVFGLWFDRLWICWFGLGYLSHVIGDFFTPQGSPVFAPLYWKCVSGASIKTGSWSESFISILLWVYICWTGFGYLPGETQRWLNRYREIAHIELPETIQSETPGQ